MESRVVVWNGDMQSVVPQPGVGYTNESLHHVLCTAQDTPWPTHPGTRYRRSWICPKESGYPQIPQCHHHITHIVETGRIADAHVSCSLLLIQSRDDVGNIQLLPQNPTHHSSVPSRFSLDSMRSGVGTVHERGTATTYRLHTDELQQN